MSLNLDKSTWKCVAFGDVIENIAVRVDDPSTAGVDRYVGLEHLDPGVMTVQRWDSPDKVEAQKLRFQPGDVIFGRRRAYQKKVARADFEGICSAHALVLRARPDVMRPDFLPVFLSSDHFLDRAIAISVGSLSPTVNWRDLRIQEFLLPTDLDEQQRIADLIWSIEQHRQLLTVTAVKVSDVFDHDRAQQFATVATSRRLGDLASTRSGPSFAASDVSPTGSDGSVPIIGITNTKPDGTLDLSNISHVSGLGDGVHTVDESSLILIRTNGNRDRIGNVYLPGPAAYRHAVSAFQFLMKANVPLDREYLYWYLSSPVMQSQMSEAASGTTGLGNLAVRWLNEQKIPWPVAPGERAAFVSRFHQLRSAVDSVLTERSKLSILRAAALADVFGGME